MGGERGIPKREKKEKRGRGGRGGGGVVLQTSVAGKIMGDGSFFQIFLNIFF